MNEVKIIVTVDGPVGDGFEKTRAKSKTFGDGVTADFAKAGKASDDFDRLITANMKRGETAFDTASRSVEELRGKVTQLRQELKSGDSGGSVFGDLTAAEADLKRLEGFISAMEPEVKTRARKVGKSAGDGFIEGIPFAGPAAMALGRGFAKMLDAVLPDVTAEAAKLGEKAGEALADGVASAGDTIAQDAPALFTPEGAAGAAILAAVGLTLAPALGAAVAAAVDGALGLGVIGLAGFLLKDEPGVRAAAKRLKDDVLGEFTNAATVELAGPFEQAMSKLDAFFASGASHIHDLFAAVAPAVAPIEQMIESMVKAIGPALVDDAKAFADIFSDPKFQSDVEGLGQNIASFFETIAHHKDEIEVTLQAVMGLASVLLGVLNVLMNIGGMLAAPLKWAEGLTGSIGPAEKAAGALTDFAIAAEKAGQTAAAAAPDYDALAAKLNQVTQNADTLAGAMSDKLFNSIMGNERAVLAWWDASDKLNASIKENGRTVDIATQKGRNNISAILDAVQANINLYDKQISLGMSAQDAAKAYDANTAALVRHLKQLGLTKAQIDSVVGAYKNVPDKVNTTIAIEGLTKAIEDLSDLIAKINGIPRDFYITPHISTAQITGRRSTGPGHHAAGGVAAGLTWVGEQGAELVRLPQGSMVYPHGQSVGMASSMAGSAGPSQLTMTIAPGAAGGVTALITNLFRTGQIRLTVRDSTGKTQAVSVAGG